MHVCGIVSEYNPFHNGHAYQIMQTRKKLPGCLIVCVMSPCFVQRGEPALFDKWTRAVCAVKSGADAVVELPVLTAVQSAEGFAAGSVRTLRSLGATHISFGSETDDIAQLQDIADTLSREPRLFKRTLKAHLKEGVSFPKARMLAAFPNAPKDVNMPNAILGVEYLKAMNKQRSRMTPIAIRRAGQGYHSDDIRTPLSSATAIRSAMREGSIDNALSSMPPAATAYLKQEMHRGLTPISPEFFNLPLFHRLLLGGTEYIQTLHEVSEGLENRVFEAAKACRTREELIEHIKTKRYTYTRISRILLYALLGITRGMIVQHNKTKPQYARVLAAANGSVLSVLSKTSRVPLIAGAVANTEYSAFDVSATDVYALAQSKPPFSYASRDFTQRLILNP